MKKTFGLFALILAVGFVAFSAFTKVSVKYDERVATSKFVTYDGSGPQTDISNYNSLATAPTTAPSACNDNIKLCWFRVDDIDEDDDIDSDDFTASFNALDDNDGSLDDQSEIAGRFEKKN